MIDKAYPAPYRMEPKFIIDRANKKRVSLYRKSLAVYRKLADPPLDDKHAHANILNLSCHSAIVAFNVFARKKSRTGRRSSCSDCWSPTAIALKNQRTAILDILGHIQGTKGRKIWRTLQERSMDATIYGPSFWKTADSLTKAEFCIERLKELTLKLHGRQ